jgi:hypothetical protein
MNVAASRSVRRGVIVRTCSVIASRTFTAPSDNLGVSSSSPRRAGWRDHTQFVPFVASRAARVTALVAHDEGDAVGLWQAAGYARDTVITRFMRSLG